MHISLRNVRVLVRLILKRDMKPHETFKSAADEARASVGDKMFFALAEAVDIVAARPENAGANADRLIAAMEALA